ncbi:MAG: hypothetical protein NT029_19560 [Armatimonadetes bacterium]|nr:hypothetical protein [Armatimonadota bacterium]
MALRNGTSRPLALLGLVALLVGTASLATCPDHVAHAAESVCPGGP